MAAHLPDANSFKAMQIGLFLLAVLPYVALGTRRMYEEQGAPTKAWKAMGQLFGAMRGENAFQLGVVPNPDSQNPANAARSQAAFSFDNGWSGPPPGGNNAFAPWAGQPREGRAESNGAGLPSYLDQLGNDAARNNYEAAVAAGDAPGPASTPADWFRFSEEVEDDDSVPSLNEYSSEGGPFRPTEKLYRATQGVRNKIADVRPNSGQAAAAPFGTAARPPAGTVRETHVIRATTQSEANRGTHVIRAATQSEANRGTHVIRAATQSEANRGTHVIRAATQSEANRGTHIIRAATQSEANRGTQVIRAAMQSEAIRGTHVIRAATQSADFRPTHKIAGRPTYPLPFRRTQQVKDERKGFSQAAAVAGNAPVETPQPEEWFHFSEPLEVRPGGAIPFRPSERLPVALQWGSEEAPPPPPEQQVAALEPGVATSENAWATPAAANVGGVDGRPSPFPAGMPSYTAGALGGAQTSNSYVSGYGKKYAGGSTSTEVRSLYIPAGPKALGSDATSAAPGDASAMPAAADVARVDEPQSPFPAGMPSYTAGAVGGAQKSSYAPGSWKKSAGGSAPTEVRSLYAPAQPKDVGSAATSSASGDAWAMPPAADAGWADGAQNPFPRGMPSWTPPDSAQASKSYAPGSWKKSTGGSGSMASGAAWAPPAADVGNADLPTFYFGEMPSRTPFGGAQKSSYAPGSWKKSAGGSAPTEVRSLYAPAQPKDLGSAVTSATSQDAWAMVAAVNAGLVDGPQSPFPAGMPSYTAGAVGGAQKSSYAPGSWKKSAGGSAPTEARSLYAPAQPKDVGADATSSASGDAWAMPAADIARVNGPQSPFPAGMPSYTAGAVGGAQTSKSYAPGSWKKSAGRSAPTEVRSLYAPAQPKDVGSAATSAASGPSWAPPAADVGNADLPTFYPGGMPSRTPFGGAHKSSYAPGSWKKSAGGYAPTEVPSMYAPAQPKDLGSAVTSATSQDAWAMVAAADAGLVDGPQSPFPAGMPSYTAGAVGGAQKSSYAPGSWKKSAGGSAPTEVRSLYAPAQPKDLGAAATPSASEDAWAMPPAADSGRVDGPQSPFPSGMPSFTSGAVGEGQKYKSFAPWKKSA